MKREPIQRVLLTLGITALLIAPALLLYAHRARSAIRLYQQHGVRTVATVTDKGRVYTPRPNRYFQISFQTAPLLEGGEFIVTEIRPATPSDWETTQVGDRIEVIYLPGAPQRAIASAALNSSPPAGRYEFGLGVLVIGGLLVAISKRTNKGE